MNTKKFLLAGIVVTIIYFLLGGFFYAWLMKDWFAANGGTGMSGEPDIMKIFLATLVYGLLMSFTYPIGYKGGSALKEGIRFGIIFALIVNGPSSVFEMAFNLITIAGFVMAIIWEIIVGAILGTITAKIYGGKAA